MQSIFVFIALFVGARAAFTPGCPNAATFPFAVTGGTGDLFTINAFTPSNPPVTIKQGCLYQFTINAGGAAFHIKNAAGTDDGTVTNNGATTGTVAWTPGSTGVFTYTTGVNVNVFGNLTVVANTASCPQYCSDYRLACTSNIYASQAECEAACAVMPSDPTYTFTPATSSNTRQCRMEQADCAARGCTTDPGLGTTCTNANFVGGYDFNAATDGLCHTSGVFCESYCEAALSACSGTPLFASSAQCLSICGNYNNGDPTPNIDSAECRIGNVVTALLSPNTGCPAASMSGGNVCGTECGVLCNTIANSGCTAGSCSTDCATTYQNLHGPYLGQPAAPNLECYIRSAFLAKSTGNTAQCNFLVQCPYPSSSAPVPSSSAPISSSARAVSSSALAVSSSAASSGNGTDSSANERQVGISLAALVLSVLAWF